VADYKKLEQEEARDGVTMRVHRFVDKRLVARGIPTPDGTGMQYIAEATEIYQLEIELSGGKALIEPGALQYLHGKIATEVIRHEERGFLSRAIASAGTGESAYATSYSGAGKIWCEPGRRHFVLATMDGEQDALLLDDKAFYACSGGISLSTHRHTNVTGLLSGNGLMQPKLSGRGVFAVESPVPVHELEVVEVRAGEEVVVDGDYMLMYSAGLNVTIGPLVRGLRNALRSGEGLVYRFSGQGSIYVMPTAGIS
jgi:uncharacterized protein (AIM24 family)